MKCLLVIDVQNGFITKETSHIVPKIIEKIDNFQDGIIIATKFVNSENSPFHKYIHWYSMSDPPEIDILEDIQKRSDYIIEKQTYTAWCEDLGKLFEEFGISEVYVVGIDTDCCVLKTVADLFENNIRPIVVKDCCASTGGEESHLAGLRVLKRLIGKNQLV